MFTPYTFAGRRIIDAQGSTFVYSDSDAAINGADERIDVYADGAQVATMRPGAVLNLGRIASRWDVIPRASSVLLQGTVHVGSGDYRPGTVNGTVTTVDGNLARSIAGFHGQATIQRTAAVNYTALAINVYTPGLSVAVHSLQVDVSSTQNVRLWTAQVSAEPTFAERRAIRNKRANLTPVSFEVNGAASYALTDSTTTGATAPDSDPTKYSNWIDWGPMRINATGSRLVLFQAPIIIPAGYALVVVGGTLAAQLGMAAEVEAVYSA